MFVNKINRLKSFRFRCVSAELNVRGAEKSDVFLFRKRIAFKSGASTSINMNSRRFWSVDFPFGSKINAHDGNGLDSGGLTSSNARPSGRMRATRAMRAASARESERRVAGRPERGQTSIAAV